jgi:hypothetical protein
MRRTSGKTDQRGNGQDGTSPRRRRQLLDSIAAKTQRPRIFLVAQGKSGVVQLPREDSNL